MKRLSRREALNYYFRYNAALLKMSYELFKTLTEIDPQKGRAAAVCHLLTSMFRVLGHEEDFVLTQVGEVPRSLLMQHLVEQATIKKFAEDNQVKTGDRLLEIVKLKAKAAIRLNSSEDNWGLYDAATLNAGEGNLGLITQLLEKIVDK